MSEPSWPGERVPQGPPPSPGDRFRVLFVCTGNICRSPLAEMLARAWFLERLGADAHRFEVSSAGVHGLVDEPMDDHTAAALVARGADPEGFRSRLLEMGHVAAADLVLGMTREHRAAAVRRCPPAVRRAFTLRELARLAGAVDDYPPRAEGDAAVARAREVLDMWCSVRGTVPPVAPEDDDIEDPIGRTKDVHERVAEQIAQALRPVVARLAG